VVDARLDGEARIVTFANGMVIVNPLSTSMTMRGGLPTPASGAGCPTTALRYRIFPMAPTAAAPVWIIDFLPHELARTIESLVDQGVVAMKRTLERAEAA
jgi:hypothetical protein